jgi:hypothetical protein
MNRDEKEALYFKSLLIRLRKDVAIRVESQNDVPFWSFVFQTTVPHIKPEFFPQSFEHPNADSMGKKCVLLLEKYADKELALCVDSDYDYLLGNSVLQNQFIFQTYTYSFENYHCYAPSLEIVLKRAANTEGVDFDIENFIKSYSKIVYPYLVESLWRASQNSQYVEKIEEDFGNKAIFIGHWKKKTPQEVLDDLNHKLSKIKRIKVPDNFVERLNDLGLNEDNAYLFVRGKNVFNGVVLNLLNNLLEMIKNDKKQAFQRIEDKKIRVDQQKMYFDGLKNTKTCLLENFNFNGCFLYKKLELDIKSAFNK